MLSRKDIEALYREKAVFAGLKDIDYEPYIVLTKTAPFKYLRFDQWLKEKELLKVFLMDLETYTNILQKLNV